MAFPAINALKVSTFGQRQNAETRFCADGSPYSVVGFTSRKHQITANYLLTTAQWDLLIADYEQNHSTAFSWDDERDSVADTRTVYYASRPTRTRAGDGITKPGHYFVTVQLVES